MSIATKKAYRAVLFVDLVDSTSIWYEGKGDDQGKVGYRMICELEGLLNAIVNEFDGVYGNFTGDGAFLLFERVKDAADAAVALYNRWCIQRGQYLLDLNLPNDDRFRLRMVIHHGLVFGIRLRFDGEWVGPAINEAARLLEKSKDEELVVPRRNEFKAEHDCPHYLLISDVAHDKWEKGHGIPRAFVIGEPTENLPIRGSRANTSDGPSETETPATVECTLRCIWNEKQKPREETDKKLADSTPVEQTDESTETDTDQSRGESDETSKHDFIAFRSLGEREYFRGNLDEAHKWFSRAKSEAPEDFQTLIWLGFVLTKLAIRSDGEKQKKLFNQAFEKYAKAVEMKPDYHEAYNNWGVTLREMTTRSDGEKQSELFNQAFEKYARAVEIKPDLHEAYNNWGATLREMATRSDGEKQTELFNQACEKYAKAVEIKPDKHEAYNNWGIALYEMAKCSDGEKQSELFNQACEKYAKAVEIKPDKHEAYNNWGVTLREQVQLNTGDERDKLLSQAEEKCQKAEELQPGAGAYNLACIAALRENEDDCRRWLSKCTEHGSLPKREHMEQDDDLVFVRDKDWFKELLEQVE